MGFKRTAGQPTKLTPELQERICDGIRKGNYLNTICRAVGISQGTHRAWYLKGEAGELDSYGRDIYVKYFEAINKAEADAEQEMVDMWQKHFDSDWRAIQTFMERRWNERWGRNDKLRQELAGKDGGSIKTENDSIINLGALSDKELTALEGIVSKATDIEGDKEGES